MWNVWGTEEGHIGSRRGTMKGRDLSENLGGEERIILKSTLKKYDGSGLHFSGGG